MRTLGKLPKPLIPEHHLWLSCSFHLQTETCVPRGRLTKTQEVQKTHKSQETPEMYKILKAPPQCHINKQLLGRERRRSHLPGCLQGMHGAPGCSFSELSPMRGWTSGDAMLLSHPCPARNPNKLTGSLSWTWVGSFLWFEVSALYGVKGHLSISPQEVTGPTKANFLHNSF